MYIYIYTYIGHVEEKEDFLFHLSAYEGMFFISSVSIQFIALQHTATHAFVCTCILFSCIHL